MRRCLSVVFFFDQVAQSKKNDMFKNRFFCDLNYYEKQNKNTPKLCRKMGIIYSKIFKTKSKHDESHSQIESNHDESHSQIKCPICCETMLYPCAFACDKHHACIKCCIEISNKNLVACEGGVLVQTPVRCPFCRHKDTRDGKTFKLMKEYAYKIYEQLLELHKETQVHYDCSYCDKKFDTIKNACEHIMHCGSYPMKCPLCNKRVNQIKFRNHYLFDCEMIPCGECWTTGTHAHILQHQQSHRSRITTLRSSNNRARTIHMLNAYNLNTNPHGDSTVHTEVQQMLNAYNINTTPHGDSTVHTEVQQMLNAQNSNNN